MDHGSGPSSAVMVAGRWDGGAALRENIGDGVKRAAFWRTKGTKTIPSHLSFPRKRESMLPERLDSRFRGNDKWLIVREPLALRGLPQIEDVRIPLR